MLRRLIAVAVAFCCVVPATANASYLDVIRDCTDNGQMDKTYTQKEYRDALSRMSTDAAQYYGCPAIIKRAQRAQASASSNNDDNGNNGNNGSAGGAGGGGGGGTTSGPTPDETARAGEDVEAARLGGASDQRVADVDVRPGELAYRDFGAVSKLPTPLLVLAFLLLGAAIAVAAYLLRGLVGSRGTSA